MTQPFTHASVIGAGSWGTALAVVLAESGLSVTLWSFEPEQTAAMRKTRQNEEFLPEIDLPENIRMTSDMQEAAQAPLILMVPPSHFLRPVAESLAAVKPPADTVLLSCSKGIEAGTGQRMSEILAETLPGHRIAVLSGPSHAEEVARHLATACVIGCKDHDLAARIQTTLTPDWFRTYTSTDMPGIELGGAIKNVFALAGGMVDGLGLGDNAKAGLITRGLAELVRLGGALGGKTTTFMGLSGIGDLMVTCYSEHSRNHRFGQALGKGKTLAEVQKSMGNMVAEGVPNAASIHEAACRAKVDTPIIDQVHAILYEDKNPAIAMDELLSRQPRPEADHSAGHAG